MANATQPAWVIHEALAHWDSGFIDEYRRVASASVFKFGGRYRTVSYQNVEVEGPALESDHQARLMSVVEFDTREIAVAWFNSQDYQDAIALRSTGATTRTVIIDACVPEWAADAERAYFNTAPSTEEAP